MHQPPDVSVIVATYQQPFTTGLALQALFSQRTDCTYEVIVCDDGSDPETIGVLLNLLAAAPIPARLTWQQDRGFRAAASRNNGIAIARGRILIFLDGDLVPEGNFVEQHRTAHVDGKTIAVGKRRWRNPHAVQGRVWPVDELWTLLRSDQAFDSQSRVVEALLSMRQRKAYNREPWASLESCNFSVTNSASVRFDDGMVGWGFEDVELAYNLTIVRGYQIINVDATAYDVQGYVDHATTWQQSDYIANLCNGFRFLDRWAHTGLTPQQAIPKHTLDSESGLWSMTPIRKRLKAPVDEQQVRGWLVERGYLPPPIP